MQDESVAAAFRRVQARTDALDIVMNNAGIAATGLNESLTPAQAHALFEVNAIGAHRVNRAALATMKPRRKGLLVNVSTGPAHLNVPADRDGLNSEDHVRRA